MSGTAGFLGTVEVSDDDVAYVDLAGMNSVSTPRTRGELDVTSFSDPAVDRITGLKDSSVSLSGFDLPADAGRILVEVALAANGAAGILYFRVRPDGTNGFVYKCRVFGVTQASSPSGTSDVSIEASAIEAWVVDP